MNQLKASIRANLSELLHLNIEAEFVNKLNEIYKKLSWPVLLYLWFEVGSVDSKYLKKFVGKWEKELHFKTIIKTKAAIKKSEFIWFDMINSLTVDEKLSNNRIKYIYKSGDRISFLKGLDLFEEVLAFCIKPKPKRQKRNDYDAQNSNSRKQKIRK